MINMLFIVKSKTSFYVGKCISCKCVTKTTIITADVALNGILILFFTEKEFHYLGLGELSLQELQGFRMSLLTVLQGGQLLLHLPLQHKTPMPKRSATSGRTSLLH